jgi:hypothetical protein
VSHTIFPDLYEIIQKVVEVCDDLRNEWMSAEEFVHSSTRLLHRILAVDLIAQLVYQ